MKKKLNLTRIFISGFLATAIMTAIIYLLPLLGIAKLDYAALMGSLLTGHFTPIFSEGWWVGLTSHFIFGTIIFPLAYVYFLYPILYSRPVIRGLAYGACLWLVVEIVVAPALGMGLFSQYLPDTSMILFENLIAHLAYGGVLGTSIAYSAFKELPVYIEHIEKRAA